MTRRVLCDQRRALFVRILKCRCDSLRIYEIVATRRRGAAIKKTKLLCEKSIALKPQTIRTQRELQASAAKCFVDRVQMLIITT